MTKITAVKFLQENFYKLLYAGNVGLFPELFNQALEMEKQQGITNCDIQISDEEIENMANAFHNYHMNQESDKYTFAFACKWYREQLKQRK